MGKGRRELLRPFPARQLIALSAVGFGVLLACSACIPDPSIPNFVVNTTVDGSDAAVGDGVCEMTAGLGDCSLRAAIDEANATTHVAVVSVPAGTYSLTRTGDDDANRVGDLDLAPRSGSIVLWGDQPGAVIDAAGAGSAIDLRSGILAGFGLSATGAAGPGLVARTGSHLTVAFSTAHGNGGAGLTIESGATASSLHSTLSDNEGAGVIGAGSYSARFTTVTANGAGGVAVQGAVTLEASAIVDQTSGKDCAPPIFVNSLGYNLDSDASCSLSEVGDVIGQPGRLGPASTDPLPVHRPRPGSPVLDAVPSGVGPCQPSPTLVDQQGRPMPIGGGCNRGADEQDAPSGAPLTVVVDSSGDAVDVVPGDGICATYSGMCTLRAAVDETNAWPSTGDTISIATGIDPTLSIPGVDDDVDASGDLDLWDTVTIQGAGATVDGAGLDRVLDHHAGALSIDHLTITGGLQSGGDEETPGNGGFGDGAGIESVGALSITDSTISNNRLLNNPASFDHPRGAGIDATGGPVAIVRTVVEDNDIANAGSGRGAGLHAVDVDDLTITESTIRRNRILGNEFSFNALGGGIMLNTSVAHIDRSTISENVASVTDGPGRGAGISTLDSDLTITQSSMSGNQGGVDFGPVNEVSSVGGTLTIVGSTVVSELPEVGLSATSGSISSSLVGVTCSGSFASGGWNIAGGWNSFAGSGCGFTQPSDLVGVDPALGDLADNGGPTPTHLPQLGSPAIDRIPIGTSGLCDGTFATDQRGLPRPVATGCDVGSVEVQS